LPYRNEGPPLVERRAPPTKGEVLFYPIGKVGTSEDGAKPMYACRSDRVKITDARQTALARLRRLVLE